MKRRACLNPDCRELFEPRSRRQRSCGRVECKRYASQSSAREWNEKIDKSKYLDQGEVKQLLESTKRWSESWWLAFRLAINAMLRREEIVSICPDDFEVSSTKAILHVPTWKRKGHPKLPVEIDASTAKDVLAFAKRCGVKGGTPIWDFCGDYVGKVFKLSLETAKMKPVYTPHALRHTGITMRAAVAEATPQGIGWLQRNARHANIATTMIYIHASEEEKKQMMSKVDWA